MTTVAATSLRPSVRTPSSGQDGRVVERALDEAKRLSREFAQSWQPRIESALAEIEAECSAANWNGDDALPINRAVLAKVHRVTDLIFCYVPVGTPPPDVTPEPDGEVSITWTRKADRVFSISIGSHDKLNYAGRLGKGDEPHDVLPFNSNDPATIQYLASFISNLYR